MPHQVKRSLVTFCLILFALFLTACSTTPPMPEVEPPVYPAPPDAARFIFERSLRYNNNVEVPTQAQKLRQFATGEAGEVNGLVKPFAVAAHQGRVYVTDTVQRAVILFDVPGQRYLEFGSEKPGELFKPTGIDISPQGEVYVADVSARRIAVFDLEGGFLRFISDPSFSRPNGVSVSPDGERLYVLDTGGVDSDNHRLYIFSSQSGELLKIIGARGTQTGQFNLPLQITTAVDGTVYVVDKGNFRVQAFTPEGEFKHSFGQIGRYPGDFFSPKGIATDRKGNIYVVDTAFGNVQLFDPQGQLLMVMGQRGQSSAPGNFMLPAGVDVDETGRVYIADQFFRKVEVYRPVHPDVLPTGE